MYSVLVDSECRQGIAIEDHSALESSDDGTSESDLDAECEQISEHPSPAWLRMACFLFSIVMLSLVAWLVETTLRNIGDKGQPATYPSTKLLGLADAKLAYSTSGGSWVDVAHIDKNKSRESIIDGTVARTVAVTLRSHGRPSLGVVPSQQNESRNATSLFPSMSLGHDVAESAQGEEFTHRFGTEQTDVPNVHSGSAPAIPGIAGAEGTAQCTVSGIAAGNMARLGTLAIEQMLASCPNATAVGSDANGNRCISAVGSFVSDVTGILASSNKMVSSCTHKVNLATQCTSEISSLVGVLGSIASAGANAELFCPKPATQSFSQLAGIAREVEEIVEEIPPAGETDPETSEKIMKVGSCVLSGVGPADLMTQSGLIVKYATENCPLVNKLGLKRRFCSINVLALIGLFEQVTSLMTMAYMQCSNHTSPEASCMTSIASLSSALIDVNSHSLFMDPFCGDGIRKLRRQAAAKAAAAAAARQAVGLEHA